ncbi:SgcJ/EcaC family oxidoreductase [Mycobacterium vicinigordonae]|uniref:SgcJ/EcaC family oxidoreductase n=1 Tax=Mycobacterium vicinigordonae TaxID=1719132 RepID=A0A7D6DY30_9MYCO|nr:SgcJ/EcaC family oxidoreductase [Mycobacterium vicinigordonae]QLL05281.1 SgcJ/EcaC family oxidoreductase [Mycobacterium vicinigordonae]
MVDESEGIIAISGLVQMHESDRPKIRATLERLFRGFALRDADLLDDVYCVDADWINAFGSTKKGGAQIVEYLRGLFADQNFTDGQLVAGPVCSLRRLGADDVLVHAHLQIAGQSLLGGGAITLRDNHSIRVVSRQADGAWRIVAEMFMDVRPDRSYVNHS